MMVIVWRANSPSVMLPLQLSPFIHVRECIISREPVTDFKNRVEFEVTKNQIIDAVTSRTTVRLVSAPDVNNLVTNIGGLLADTDKCFLTIPLYNMKRIALPDVSIDNHGIKGIETIGDSIIVSSNPVITRTIPGRPRYFINGSESATPCSMCTHKPIVPGYCLLYADKYTCLFSSVMPDLERRHRLLVGILSGVATPEDCEKLAAVNYDPDTYATTYFAEYMEDVQEIMDNNEVNDNG